MVNEPVSKAEYARRCGVSAAAVTKALKGALAAAKYGRGIDFRHPAAQEYYERQTAERPAEPVPGVDPLFEEALVFCKGSGRWTATAIQRALKTGYARAVRIRGQLAAAGHCAAETPNVAPTGQAPAPRPPKAPPPPPSDDEELHEPPDDLGEMADWTLRRLLLKFGTAARFYDWLKALKELEAVEEKQIKNAAAKNKLVSRRLVANGVIDPFNSVHVRLMTDGAKTITSAVLAKHKAGATEQEIEAYVSDVIGSFIKPVKDKIDRNLASVDKDD